MDDFDIAQSKIGESAQRVVDRAIEESRRRDHALRDRCAEEYDRVRHDHARRDRRP